MKARPILFSTAMVQAILDGRKTQTRRVVKVRGCKPFIPPTDWPKIDVLQWAGDCPYGQPGDVLYVKETHWSFGEWEANGSTKTGKQKWEFKRHIDSDVLFESPRQVESFKFKRIGWYNRPSLFMCACDARLFLRIKSIRVERLQEISNDDIRAEGAAEFGCTTHRLNWHTFWQSINGPESWEANPWVWVVEFERISRQEAGL
jgi:hypothetical protein